VFRPATRSAVGVARGQHQHGRLDGARAQIAAKIDALLARQHPVEHDQVVSDGIAFVLALFGAVRHVDDEALFLQAARQQARRLAVIFHQEDSHACLSRCAGFFMPAFYRAVACAHRT